jgi:DNA polymerase-3 subunit delta'
MSAVLERVPGQEVAVAFLRGSVRRPHHAYVLAGPEGSGKSLAARAFVASLLCREGGCGTCRECRLALADQHPNEFVVEPEGRDIHVETIRDEVWQPAYLTPPEPGRKVFLIREADRLSPAAADTLLKVLEEPPADSVFVLLSARAHELPETVWSRCHVVTFTALSERFVVEQLELEGVPAERATVAARLSFGNLGRARRLAADEDGLAFRDVADEVLLRARGGPAGALEGADIVVRAAAEHKKAFGRELDAELAPFLDERGRQEEAYRAAIRRIETRFHRRERRAEREFVDRVLMAASALLRDRIASSVGASGSVLLGTDRVPDEPGSLEAAVAGVAAMEEARAALADDVNLNARLVLERALLHSAGEAP